MSTALNAFGEPRRPYRLTPEQFAAMPATDVELARRQRIRDLAGAMFRADLDGTGLERITQGHPLAEATIHRTEGIYTRELHMAAGLRVVGMRHRQEHMNVIASGRATVFTEAGVSEVSAGMVFVSPAGTQRVVVVHEDMVWVTVHRCDEQDDEKAFACVFMDEAEVMGLEG